MAAPERPKPHPRRHLPAYAVIVAGLLALPAAGGDWLGAGGGPAVTGVIKGGGPLTDDIAYEVQLPGAPNWEIIIKDGTAYVSIIALGATGRPEAPGLWALELDTGALRHVVPLTDGVDKGLVLDGLYVAWQAGGSPDLVGFDLEGNRLWTTRPSIFDVGYGGLAGNDTLPEDPGRASWWYMEGMVVTDGVLYVGVRWNDSSIIVAFDARTGQELWIWQRQGYIHDAFQQGGEPADAHAWGYWIGMAAADGRLFAFIPDLFWTGCWLDPAMEAVVPAYCYNAGDTEIWAFDAATGEVLWETRSSIDHRFQALGQAPFGTPQAAPYGPLPAVGKNAAYVRLDQLVGLNPANGNVIWETPAGQADHWDDQFGYAFGVRDDAVYAATLQTLLRMDPESGKVEWDRIRPATTGEMDTIYSVIPIATTEAVGYIETATGDVDAGRLLGSGIQAFSLENGDVIWEWDRAFDPQDAGEIGLYGSFAVDSGKLVTTHTDGRVIVFGATSASVGLPPIGDSLRLAPGTPWRLDLGGGAPGLTGPPTSYRVDWGDGTVDDWSSRATFEHTYERGSYTAQVQARNDAGHSTSHFVDVTVAVPTEVFVEDVPEPRPSLLRSPFAAENQDMSFGVIGILLALAGAILGFWRARRHRSQLHQELAALEEEDRANAGNELDWRDAMTKRQERWRTLHRGGKLTDSHVNLLGRRADELARTRRVGALETEFSFLPHGIVKTLVKMLRDGHITAIENDAIARAVDDDESMTAAQKRRVKARVAAWAE